MAYDELRAGLRSLGLHQRAIAEAVGMDENKLSKSFNGARRLTAEELDRLRALLAGRSAEAEPAVRSIPVIGLVAAGNWREAVQHSRSRMPCPDPSVPPNTIALDVEGDSMDLIVQDGGRVLVDPDDRSLFPGRYYVIENGAGETTFKRFAADPARLVPCSSNPDHKEILVGSAQFTVVGRVIGSWTEL